MKNLPARLWVLLCFFTVTLSSCEIVKGIFKAGVWVGVLVVAGIIAVIVVILRSIVGKK